MDNRNLGRGHGSRNVRDRPLADILQTANVGGMDAQAILNGQKPSVVFLQYLAAHPGSDKSEVALAFAEAFPDVDSVSDQVIWNWRRPGMADEKLDLILVELLRKAGYSFTVD